MRRCEAPDRHPNERARRGSIGEALPVAYRPAGDPHTAGERHQHIGEQVVGERPDGDRHGEGDRGLVRTADHARAPLLGRGEPHDEPKAVEVRALGVREHGQLQLVPPRHRGREGGFLVEALEAGVAAPQGVVQESVLEREPAVHKARRGDIRRR